MKLPNGYGSVVKLSGSRRKPWLARVTTGWTIDVDSGKAKQDRMHIGTFKTKKEALQALADYSANPYDISEKKITLQELYSRWTKTYFQSIAKSSTRTITSAWKYCSSLYGMRASDLRARHIKGVIENGYIIDDSKPGKDKRKYASPGTKQRIKSLFNLMLDFALEYEIVDKNYARTFNIADDVISESNDAKRGHIIFSDDEMQKLWDNVGKIRFVDWILIQCYMGWRPQELAIIPLDDVHLDDGYIVGGMKTSSGRNRIVPIHSRIMALVQKNYNQAKELGSDRLFNDPLSSKGGMKLTYDKYAGRFRKTMAALNFRSDHRPHDPRKTFITMAKKAGVDEYVIKRIAGHRIDDITEGTYTVRDLEWLRADIEKIP